MSMYHDDCRVRAAKSNTWYTSFNTRTKMATVSFKDEDGEECEIEVPCKYEVCPLCEGEGYHVDPSIDAEGLSAEDFQEDPEFAEAYFNGAYNVRCYECKGNNVVPVVDLDRLTEEQKKIWERIVKEWDEDARFEHECAMERRMGA